jgi:hypothetical protein
VESIEFGSTQTSLTKLHLQFKLKIFESLSKKDGSRQNLSKVHPESVHDNELNNEEKVAKRAKVLELVHPTQETQESSDG